METSPSKTNKSACKRPTKAVLDPPKILIVEDQRIQVHNTSKWPYSVHGVVISKFKDYTRWGTGVLIGPNIVLTAGHILYHYEDKVYGDIQSVRFLPGINGKVLPFGLVGVKKVLVSPNYIKEGKEDFGILILKESIGEKTGYFGLACLEPEEIKDKRINVTGYPADKVESRPNTYEMWGMEGQVVHIDQDKGLINYVIDTESGQAGSGVWYQEGEDYYVCGVHISASTSFKSATLVTRAIYDQIDSWRQE